MAVRAAAEQMREELYRTEREKIREELLEEVISPPDRGQSRSCSLRCACCSQSARSSTIAHERGASADRVTVHRRMQETQRLSVERLKLRQRIVKEETAAFRRRLEEEERDKIEAMRNEVIRMGRLDGRAFTLPFMMSSAGTQVAEELKASQLSEDKMKLDKPDDSTAAKNKSWRDAKNEALELQIQAAKAKQASMDEVTRREVEEYAAYLGMNTAEDRHLFWIAEMALTAPLPAGWGEHQDSKGNIFFHNKDTGASTYEHPMDASFKAYYQKLKAAHV